MLLWRGCTNNAAMTWNEISDICRPYGLVCPYLNSGFCSVWYEGDSLSEPDFAFCVSQRVSMEELERRVVEWLVENSFR